MDKSSPIIKEIQDFSKRFDSAYFQKDCDLIKQLISEAESLSYDKKDISELSLLYSIGNAYGDLENLSKEIHDNYIEKQIYFYRKGIDILSETFSDNWETDDSIIPYLNGLKINLYTNYANILHRIGRTILAIEYYKKALQINPKFGMAMGNLGMCYQHYAMLDYDTGHTYYLHHFAHDCLQFSLLDTNLLPEAKDCFAKYLKLYDDKEDFKKPLNIKQYNYDEQLEYEYRKWVLENNLFLNTLNDLPVSEFMFATDPIHLPSMTVSCDDKPVCHGMYNQLKQEFIYARYLFYLGTHSNEEVHFADKDIFLYHFVDYPQYCIAVEHAKTSFRLLYSILDKTAFFLNKYYDLGIKTKDVNFRSIWKDAKYGKNKQIIYKYKNVLNPNENHCLSGIRWVYKDFFEHSSKTNPNSKYIGNIRNAIEHRYLKVFNDDFTLNPQDGIDDLAEYISLSELFEQTMIILKTVREVIILLSLTVNLEERKSENNNSVVAPIQLQYYDQDWKRI